MAASEINVMDPGYNARPLMDRLQDRVQSEVYEYSKLTLVLLVCGTILALLDAAPLSTYYACYIIYFVIESLLLFLEEALIPRLSSNPQNLFFMRYIGSYAINPALSYFATYYIANALNLLMVSVAFELLSYVVLVLVCVTLAMSVVLYEQQRASV